MTGLPHAEREEYITRSTLPPPVGPAVGRLGGIRRAPRAWAASGPGAARGRLPTGAGARASVDGLRAAAAPAVGAEGHGRFAQRPQTFEVAERGGGHGHHAAVERRGAEGHGGGVEHLAWRSA